MRTVSAAVRDSLKAYSAPYAVGVPGHGNWALVDAFHRDEGGPPFLQVMHEQSAAHMADATFRLTGRPAAVLTSVGPGSTNTVTGLATAYSDSSAVLSITGAAARHMSGFGTMQTLDRKYAPDFPRIVEPMVKKAVALMQEDAAPAVMASAYRTMLTGRPGPVNIDIPLDVQVAQTTPGLQPLADRLPIGRTRPDPDAVERAARLSQRAERIFIVAGGGAITSEASNALARLASNLGALVGTTWNGKGAIPDSHPLCAGPIGVGGSRAANMSAASADVVIALGCRFSDWTSSSYRKGVTFSIPPAALIHADIDPDVIGAAYPTAVGVVANVRSFVEDLEAALPKRPSKAQADARARYRDLHAAHRKAWETALAPRLGYRTLPCSMLAALAELRRAVPEETVATVGSGHCQAAVRQGFPVYAPRTHITSGGFSTMGFAAPAAMAAAFEDRRRPAVAILGDGDMMMSLQDIAACVQHNLPVLFFVLNNEGFMSIRDGANAIYGRSVGVDFRSSPVGTGGGFAPDFAAIGRSFGLSVASRPESFADIPRLIHGAIQSGGPAILDIPITRDAALAGAEPAGWWDFPPSRTASPEVQADYVAGRAAQQHLGADVSDIALREPLGIYG